MTALAFEERARFDREGLVQDRAFDMAGGRQRHALGADRTDDLAAHDDFLAHDFAVDEGFLADRQRLRADIAFDLAVDLDVARGNERARDDEIGGDDGRRGARAPRLGDADCGGRGRPPEPYFWKT